MADPDPDSTGEAAWLSGAERVEKGTHAVQVKTLGCSRPAVITRGSIRLHDGV